MNSEYFKFHKCPKLVSVQGFTYSGSSAVLDLLNECIGVRSIYTSEPQSLNRTTLLNNAEFQLFKVFNIMELRDSISRNLPGKTDRYLKELMKSVYVLLNTKRTGLVMNLYHNTDFKLCVYLFLLDILDLSDFDLNVIKSYFDIFEFPVTVRNPNYEDLGIKSGFHERLKSAGIDLSKFSFCFNNEYIFYKLKNEVDLNYFDLAIKKMFIRIGSVIAPYMQVLALDNFTKYLYINDISTMLPEDSQQIVVYRDPRDMYYFIRQYDWIEVLDYHDYDLFIEKMKAENLKNKYISNDKCLLLRFEDLLLKYDLTVAKIFDFLKINPAYHNRIKFHFNPEISSKYIGCYKAYHDQSVMIKIANALPEWME